MIYAYDETVPIPTIDLYDSLLMAQSIANAKERYNQAEKRLDDLENQLGDFYSPFAKDMQWYKTNVEDHIKNTLDDLYSKGIDPLRSAEGRAALRRLERSVPKSTINQMKANAALYEKYRELVDALKAEGKYNEDFDDFMRKQNGLGRVEDFSTVGPNGLNTFYGAPYKYSDASTLYTPYVKDLEKSVLTEQQMRDQYPNVPYDPINDYKARTPESIRKALRKAMPGLAGNPNYEYQRDLARRDLIKQNALNGGDPSYVPTEQEINNRTEDMAFGSVSRFVTQPEAEPNDIRKMTYQYDLMDRNAKRAAARTAGSGHGNKGGRGSSSTGEYSYLSNALAFAVNASEKSFKKRQALALDNARKNKTGAVGVIQLLSIRDDSDVAMLYYLGRKAENDGKMPYIPEQDSQRMLTADELIADMGRRFVTTTNATNIKKSGDKLRRQIEATNNIDSNKSASIRPTGNAVFYEDKNGNIRHYVEFVVRYATKDGKQVREKQTKMYMDTGAQYDYSYMPTGNFAQPIAADQRASKAIANTANKTSAVTNPTTVESIEE